MQEPAYELSLENQFKIRHFEQQVQNMSLDQSNDFLIYLYKQMLTQEHLYRSMILNSWFKDNT
jgi:Phycobilisome degradation protein nblA